MSLIKKPLFWVSILAVGAAGWVLTNPEDAPKKSTPSRVTKKKTSNKKTTVQFIDADFEADFKPLNSELKNAFQPIVIRKSGGFGGGEGAANVIPADFTGGDTGWVYTGNAEIDGASMALLENRTTGEGVFLKAGERWKSAAVSKILTDAVVMSGPSGIKTFTLVTEEPRMARNGFNPASVNVPSGLRGQIEGSNGRNQNGGFGRDGQAFQVLPNAGGGGMITVPSGGGPDVVFAPME